MTMQQSPWVFRHTWLLHYIYFGFSMASAELSILKVKLMNLWTLCIINLHTHTLAHISGSMSEFWISNIKNDYTVLFLYVFKTSDMNSKAYERFFFACFIQICTQNCDHSQETCDRGRRSVSSGRLQHRWVSRELHLLLHSIRLVA